MPGLVPGIHAWVIAQPQRKTWMAGTSPAFVETDNRDDAVSNLAL